MKKNSISGFTIKRDRQKSNSYYSFTNECREQNLSSGFTLIESLVAVTIVTFAVAGPLFSANRAIVSAQGARLQLTASHLAQEGIEHVRAIRDDAYLIEYQNALGNNSIDPSTASWTDFVGLIDQCNPNPPNIAKCTLDPTLTMGVGNGNSLAPCSGTCVPLYLHPFGYTQQSSGGTLTPYTRVITAEPVSPNEEHIVSKVTWSFHGTLYVVTVSDHLSPWQ